MRRASGTEFIGWRSDRRDQGLATSGLGGREATRGQARGSPEMHGDPISSHTSSKPQHRERYRGRSQRHRDATALDGERPDRLSEEKVKHDGAIEEEDGRPEERDANEESAKGWARQQPGG